MSTEREPLYVKMGGETALREFVEHFYFFMDSLTEAQGIRAMHPDLDRAKERLFSFLSGWTGGPQLFVEKYGEPRLRARHLPFVIGEKERDQWLLCFFKAMEKMNFSEEVRLILRSSISRLADHMRNQPEK